MEMEAYIDDGENFDGVIEARPGLHQKITFVYRPVSAEGLSEYAFLSRNLIGIENKKKTCEFLAPRIIRWDLTRRNAAPGGQTVERIPVEIKPETIIRLQENVFNDLFEIIFCQKPGVREERDAKAKN